MFDEISTDNCGDFYTMCPEMDKGGNVQLVQHFVLGSDDDSRNPFFLSCSHSEAAITETPPITGERPTPPDFDHSAEIKITLQVFRDENFSEVMEEDEVIDLNGNSEESPTV